MPFCYCRGKNKYRKKIKLWYNKCKTKAGNKQMALKLMLMDDFICKTVFEGKFVEFFYRVNQGS